MPEIALLADVGGTNTRVALSQDGAFRPETARRYANAEFQALEPLLTTYLTETGALPRSACLAMAGPVRDGVGELTNLNWTLDTGALAQATGIAHVALLNDLQAQGHALGHLPDTALTRVLPGETAPNSATQLVVGVGTGFNAALVLDTPEGRHVPPAEAGHVSLPVHDETTLRLARHLATAHGFASVEDVLSGRGLSNVHDWLVAETGQGQARTSQDIFAAMMTGDSLADAAVRHMVGIFGAVLGDLALTLLPFGGIYLIGGDVTRTCPTFSKPWLRFWVSRQGAVHRLHGSVSSFGDHG